MTHPTLPHGPRWKSPRIPLLYNRNLAAEQGAAGRLLGKMK